MMKCQISKAHWTLTHLLSEVLSSSFQRGENPVPPSSLSCWELYNWFRRWSWDLILDWLPLKPEFSLLYQGGWRSTGAECPPSGSLEEHQLSQITLGPLGLKQRKKTRQISLPQLSLLLPCRGHTRDFGSNQWQRWATAFYIGAKFAARVGIALIFSQRFSFKYLFQIPWWIKKKVLLVCLAVLSSICYAPDFVDLEFGLHSGEIAYLFHEAWVAGVAQMAIDGGMV